MFSDKREERRLGHFSIIKSVGEFFTDKHKFPCKAYIRKNKLHYIQILRILRKRFYIFFTKNQTTAIILKHCVFVQSSLFYWLSVMFFIYCLQNFTYLLPNQKGKSKLKCANLELKFCLVNWYRVFVNIYIALKQGNLIF